MFSSKDSKIVPRNGHALVAGVVARISGCQNQKEISLDDQVDHAKEIVADLYTGLAEYRVIATKGKGERLDRPELRQIEALLRTRELDLLVMEDSGRLVRGGEASRLCGIAVDHGVRAFRPMTVSTRRKTRGNQMYLRHARSTSATTPIRRSV
jgi:site-specific DNA recombinase